MEEGKVGVRGEMDGRGTQKRGGEKIEKKGEEE